MLHLNSPYAILIVFTLFIVGVSIFLLANKD